MASWNGLDFIVFLIFALNTVLGMSRGALKEMIAALCVSIGLIFMIKFTVPLAHFLNGSPLISVVAENQIVANFMQAIHAGPLTAAYLMQVAYSISILLCFTAAYSICAAGMARTGIIEAYPYLFATFSRQIGGVLGFARGFVINLIMLTIFTVHLFTPNGPNLLPPSFIAQSYFVTLYRGAIINLDAIITGQNPDQYREIFKYKDLYTPEMLQQQLNAGTYNTTQQNNNNAGKN